MWRGLMIDNFNFILISLRSFAVLELNYPGNFFSWMTFSEVDLRVSMGCMCPPYFFQSLAFCNYYEELETLFFEVELINNAPLACVYLNKVLCSFGIASLGKLLFMNDFLDF